MAVNEMLEITTYVKPYFEKKDWVKTLYIT